MVLLSIGNKNWKSWIIHCFKLCLSGKSPGKWFHSPMFDNIKWGWSFHNIQGILKVVLLSGGLYYPMSTVVSRIFLLVDPLNTHTLTHVHMPSRGLVHHVLLLLLCLQILPRDGWMDGWWGKQIKSFFSWSPSTHSLTHSCSYN